VRSEVWQSFRDRQDTRDVLGDRRQREHGKRVIHRHRQAEEVTRRAPPAGQNGGFAADESDGREKK